MAILPILQYPDPHLKLVAQPVTDFDHTLSVLVENMFDTMYAAHGVGLAATQVGVLSRVITMNIATTEHSMPLCLINPRIIAADGDITFEEGCLSFPGIYVKIRRKSHITLEYCDLTGSVQQLECSGLQAICIQHELDHLQGIVFLDHLSPLKQAMLRKKLNKIKNRENCE